MGGADAEQVAVTAEQVEAIKQAEATFARYEEVGIPAENRLIELTTGKKWNAETNGYEDSADGPKVDNSSAKRSSNRAATEAMMANAGSSNGVLDGISDDMAEQEMAAASEMGLTQQTNKTKGLVNAAKMLKGQETDAIATQSQLAANAQGKAIDAAQTATDEKANKGYMVGNVAGLAVGAAAGKFTDAKDGGGVLADAGNVSYGALDYDY